MSRNEHPDDLSGLPFSNEEERAEFDWLVARETDPDAPAPTARTAAEYADLENWLGDIPSPPLDDAWHDQVLHRARDMSMPSEPRHARGRWVAVGAGLAAAAVILMIMRPAPDRPKTDALAESASFEITPQQTRGDTGAARYVVGVHTHVRAAVESRLVIKRPLPAEDVRLYEGEALVARCPDSVPCHKDEAGERIDYVFAATGRYTLIVIGGPGQNDLPTTLPLAELKSAAGRAHRHLVETQIEVR